MSTEIKIKRGSGTTPALADGELGFNKSNKILTIGTDQGNVDVGRPILTMSQAEYDTIEPDDYAIYVIETDDVIVTNSMLESGLATKASANHSHTLASIGAAPSGFGLGTTGEYKQFSTFEELNTLVYDGWYAVNFANTVTVDGLNFQLAVVKVCSYTADYVYQKITPLGYNCVIHRSSYAGTWSVVEWENPPCADGVVYRTTQRFRGLPVYEVSIPVGYVSAGSNSFAHGAPLTYAISLDIINNEQDHLNGYSGITNLTVDRTNIHMGCTSAFGNIVFRMKFV